MKELRLLLLSGIGVEDVSSIVVDMLGLWSLIVESCSCSVLVVFDVVVVFCGLEVKGNVSTSDHISVDVKKNFP